MSSAPAALAPFPAAPPPAPGAEHPKPRTVVYACSGCSDAGELADHIARRLSREGAAQMSCLAGIGGRVKSLLTKAEQAEHILVIDGCPLSCARNTLKLAGFEEFSHLGLHELGLRKGACPPTEENLTKGVDAAKQVIEQVTPHALQRSGVA